MVVLVCSNDINSIVNIVNGYSTGKNKIHIIADSNKLDTIIEKVYFDKLILDNVYDIKKISFIYYDRVLIYRINRVFYYNDKEIRTRQTIKEKLIELKFDYNDIGTKYLIDVIYYYSINTRFKSLKEDFYYILSKKYKVSINSIIQAIYRATEKSFCCDNGMYNYYFNRNVIEKPSINELIKIISYKIKEEV
jgi:hypothetical protein